MLTYLAFKVSSTFDDLIVSFVRVQSGPESGHRIHQCIHDFKLFAFIRQK